MSRDFSELVHRVARLYSRAYPDFQPGGRVETRIAEAAREDAVLGDPTPREVVRRTVLELDAERLSKARSAR
jgi:hypothetical protein